MCLSHCLDRKLSKFATNSRCWRKTQVHHIWDKCSFLVTRNAHFSSSGLFYEILLYVRCLLTEMKQNCHFTSLLCWEAQGPFLEWSCHSTQEFISWASVTVGGSFSRGMTSEPRLQGWTWNSPTKEREERDASREEDLEAWSIPGTAMDTALEGLRLEIDNLPHCKVPSSRFPTSP